MRSHRVRGLLFAGWVAWACFVLAHYYFQALRAIREPQVPAGRDVIAAIVPLLLFAAGTAVFRAIGRRQQAAAAPALSAVPVVTGRAAALVLLWAAIVTVPWLLVWPRLSAALSGFGVPAFPWFGEAMARLTVALTGASLVAAASVSAGILVLRLLNCRFASRTEYLLFAA